MSKTSLFLALLSCINELLSKEEARRLIEYFKLPDYITSGHSALMHLRTHAMRIDEWDVTDLRNYFATVGFNARILIRIFAYQARVHDYSYSIDAIRGFVRQIEDQAVRDGCVVVCADWDPADGLGVKPRPQQVQPPIPKEDGNNNNNEDGRMCVVCMDKSRDRLLLPCKHLVLCGDCASDPSLAMCPVCRVAIQDKLQVFIP
jgi:hypothetical protein